MLREVRTIRQNEDRYGFRLRGQEVTRLESFADAVFAFALTLLVVSLEVPKSFVELIDTMRGFLAFAVCFAILAAIWNDHYHFSRRFGLQDGVVRFLTCVLLFIVLLYVYPLKFLFNLFINGSILHLPGARTVMTARDARILFVIYGLGYAGVHIGLTLLYVHAYRCAAELDLTPGERLATKWEIAGFLCQAGVGVASTILALSLPPHWLSWCGFIYFSLFIILWAHGLARKRSMRRAL